MSHTKNSSLDCCVSFHTYSGENESDGKEEAKAKKSWFLPIETMIETQIKSKMNAVPATYTDERANERARAFAIDTELRKTE